jgi:hypothetical protein
MFHIYFFLAINSFQLADYLIHVLATENKKKENFLSITFSLIFPFFSLLIEMQSSIHTTFNYLLK